MGGGGERSQIYPIWSHFMKMVITRVEDASPDMIPVAFEAKFDEKKDGVPPGIYRPHILQIIQYWEWED